MKKIIGVIGQVNGFNSNNPFDDRYYFLNNFSQAISKNDAIPLGILMNNEKLIKEALDLCDGFIITGGLRIEKYHYDIIDYCKKYNKPLLGVCLGMQAMGLYNNYHDLIKIENHDNHVTYQNKNTFHHEVKVSKNTKLFDIYKSEKILVNSFHNYKIKSISKEFIISARYKDVIEAVEHKEKPIIGVQWHPELLDEDKLIKWLIEVS